MVAQGSHEDKSGLITHVLRYELNKKLLMEGRLLATASLRAHKLVGDIRFPKFALLLSQRI